MKRVNDKFHDMYLQMPLLLYHPTDFIIEQLKNGYTIVCAYLNPANNILGIKLAVRFRHGLIYYYSMMDSDHNSTILTVTSVASLCPLQLKSLFAYIYDPSFFTNISLDINHTTDNLPVYYPNGFSDEKLLALCNHENYSGFVIVCDPLHYPPSPHLPKAKVILIENY